MKETDTEKADHFCHFLQTNHLDLFVILQDCHLMIFSILLILLEMLCHYLSFDKDLFHCFFANVLLSGVLLGLVKSLGSFYKEILSSLELRFLPMNLLIPHFCLVKMD